MKHYMHNDETSFANSIERTQLYADHVLAMTAEGLHDKSDIAAELARRDKRIRELEQELAAAKKKTGFGFVKTF